MNLIQQIESQYMKKDVPDIHPGDTVKVSVRIVEGEKERIQVVEGVVIRIRGGGIRKTITVRKVAFNVGVERIFPVHSPKVEKVEIVKRAKVRRAKLYYLRELRGKAARLKELKKPTQAGKKKRTRTRRAKPKAAAKA